MKNLSKKLIPAGLLLFTLTGSAQVTNDYSTVKDAFFALTAIVQTTNGEISKVRITNKDIIAALNATGAFNFTNNPKLLMRSDNSAQPYFIVRDSGTNEVDVSDYLTVTTETEAVHGVNSMLNWAMWNVTLNGGALMDFSFWSLTTLNTGRIPIGGDGYLERTVSLSSTGSGPGHINGQNAQFSGTASASHGRIDSLAPNFPD
jgi:hypothetical protein